MWNAGQHGDADGVHGLADLPEHHKTHDGQQDGREGHPLSAVVGDVRFRCGLCLIHRYPLFSTDVFNFVKQISVVVKSIPVFSMNTIKCFTKEVAFLGEYTRIPNRVRGGTAPFFCLRNTAKYRTFLPPNRKGWRFFDTICNEMQSNICF